MRVRITGARLKPTVYTLDGTPPTARSPVYDGPVSLPEGGTLRDVEQSGRANVAEIAVLPGTDP